MFHNLLGLPIDASAQGHQIDSLIGWVHLLMAVLFIGWILFFFYMLIRFRKSRNPRADHEGVKTHASSYVEAVILILEIVLLFSLSIPFWANKVNALPESENPLHVHIIAQQFAWNVHYPGKDGKFGKTDYKLIDDANGNPIGLDRKADGADDVIELNQLHLPVNRPVVIDLMTKDVIHSFFLPMFRVKQDAIPGMMIPIHFTPTMTTAEIRSNMIETVQLPPHNRNLELYAPLEDYKDKDGTVLAKAGAGMTATVVKKLMDAGVTSLSVAPVTPTEIACAQLCGINHYRMKGFVVVESAEDFQKWYDKEAEDQKE